MGRDLRTVRPKAWPKDPLMAQLSQATVTYQEGPKNWNVSSFWIHYLCRIRSEWLEIANAYTDVPRRRPVGISEDPVLENACGLMKTLTDRPIANQRSGSGNYLPTTRPARSLRLGHGRKHRVFDSQKLRMCKGYIVCFALICYQRASLVWVLCLNWHCKKQMEHFRELCWLSL